MPWRLLVACSTGTGDGCSCGSSIPGDRVAGISYCVWSVTCAAAGITSLMATHSQVRSPAVANALLGLQQLGLRLDSDASILHELSQRLPDGMFDGHGSVFPAPDHLVFHGLARCCMKALFKALPRDLKIVVAASLRDALFHCRLT